LDGLITVTDPGLIATKYSAHTISFILLDLARHDLTSADTLPHYPVEEYYS
jgi:hypothetical protein